jgi:hypothetical protein
MSDGDGGGVMTVRLVEFEDPTHRANVIVTKTTTWDLFVQKVKERLGYLTIDTITNEDGDAVESLEDLEHRGTCFVQGQSYAKLKRLHNAYQNRTVTEGGKVETTSAELAALMDNVELAIDAAVVDAKLAEEEEEGIHLRAGQFRARFFSSSLGIGLEPGEGNIGAIVSEPPEPGMDGSGADSEDLEEDEKNPVCVEDTLIYVEDASVAGLSFEDVVVVIKSASPPRSLIFERARTITLSRITKPRGCPGSFTGSWASGCSAAAAAPGLLLSAERRWWPGATLQVPRAASHCSLVIGMVQGAAERICSIRSA